MKKPPSDYENKRLQNLDTYQIIGVLEAEDFDFLTSLAAEICNTKVSLISFVTRDKQWFLSHHGLEVRETPREYSFCAHAIDNPEQLLVIEDARKDARFSNNPLVNSTPNFVFYAGVPIVSSEGFPLGSFCVIDDNPKKLTPNQENTLKKLAKQAGNLLELRKRNLELKWKSTQNELKLELITSSQNFNKIGAWEMDIATGITQWTDMVYDIHEVSREFDHNNVNGIEFYHPDYRETISDAIKQAIELNKSFDVIAKFVTAKGNLKWVRSTGKRKGERLLGSFQDITEIKQNEIKFEGIFNSSMSFIGFLNPEGILLEANDTALKMAGITREDVVGNYFWDCYWWQISKQTQEELRNNFKKAVAGTEVVYEVVVWIAHQVEVTILFSLRPVMDDQGNVIFIIPEGRPINELVNTRNSYKSVLEGTNVGTWIWNVQTGETFFNERWAEMIGYSLKELHPISIKTWAELAHPDDLAESNRRLQHCFDRKEEFYEMEARMKHKAGHWVWVYDRGKVFSWTAEGLPLMMYGTHQDISKEKEAEQKLREAINKLQSILDASTQVSIIATDSTGTITLFNSGAEKMLGYSPEELVGTCSPAIIHVEEEVKAHGRSLEKEFGMRIENFDVFVFKAKLGKSETKEWTYVRKDGSKFPVLLSVTAIKVQEEAVGYLGVATDITELKKAQSKIEMLLDITTEQNGLLQNFAHIVSHNLRSHSAGISGLFELLKLEDPEYFNDSELLQFMEKGAENLKTTISDLNDIVNSNLTKVEFEAINLSEVILKNIESLHAMIKASGFEIINMVAMDVWVSGVPAFIDSIVLNFLTNAIKYRDREKKSYLKISAKSRGNYMELALEDNGLGIDLKKHGDNLFRMYKTFHGNTDSRGVGLFITKNQIERMGGKIEVQSEVNIGTVFKVYLPLK